MEEIKASLIFKEHRYEQGGGYKFSEDYNSASVTNTCRSNVSIEIFWMCSKTRVNSGMKVIVNGQKEKDNGDLVC